VWVCVIQFRNYSMDSGGVSNWDKWYNFSVYAGLLTMRRPRINYYDIIIHWLKRTVTKLCDLQSVPGVCLYGLRHYHYRRNCWILTYQTGCNIRENWTSRQFMSPGGEKQISTSSGAQLSPELSNYILTKFSFHRQTIAWFIIINSGPIELFCIFQEAQT
jgi:hypothetical protein